MEKASVNLLTNSMQVEYDDNILSSSDIENAVINAGYGIGGSDATSSSAKSEKNNEKDEMLHRLVYSFVFLLFLMSISMSHMIAKTGFPIPQWFQNIFWGNENAITFAFAQFLIVLPILYLNRIYYIRGYKNLFHLSPNMDTLIAVGSSASMFYGIFALFRMSWGLGHGNMDLVGTYSMDLYFESAGMIVTLITLGKYLESRSKKKTSKAIEKLVALAPKEAEIERNGHDEQWEHFRQEDGHIYWIPQFCVSQGENVEVTHTGEAFWIQTRVLKWAGYPKITTVDEYFDLIEAYVQANPVMPGGTKNVPFTMLCDDWRFFCLENVPQFLDGYPNDGSCMVDPGNDQVIDYNTTETARRYFQKLNEEYRKGIFDPQSFTSSNTSETKHA